MPVVKILKYGQVTLPKAFRDALGLEQGDLAEAELKGDQIVITPKKLVDRKKHRELFALLDEVHAQNEGVMEEEVVKYATEAVAELRREERQKQNAE